MAFGIAVEYLDMQPERVERATARMSQDEQDTICTLMREERV
jgi:hypothetical protein